MLPHTSARWALLAAAGAASLIALLSARPFAGSWNDGSRLATVEALVDCHTLAIDDSIFVQPWRVDPGAVPPYEAETPALTRLLLDHGTSDKLFIGGHFYSDKPPVPAVLLAGVYWLARQLTGLTARHRPDVFCYLMTVASSGLAYVAAVVSFLALSRRVLPALRQSLLLTASFAVGTVALAYTRQTNSHIMFLGVAMPMMFGLDVLAQRLRDGRRPGLLLAGLGTLAGLGYGMDQGVGPMLLVTLLPLLIYRLWRAQALVLVAPFLLGLLPWLALHHGLNYHIGGTIGPANAVAAYFQYPGSTFTVQSMTGHWAHPNLYRAATYALELLVGKKGFLLHNLALFFAAPGALALIVLAARRRIDLPELPELLFAMAWSAGTWLLYSWGSKNYSGMCLSVRWFVPLLAPAFYILALVLRQRPELWPAFLAVNFWAIVIGALAWWKGPWAMRMVPGFWFLLGAVLASYGAVWWLQHRPRRAERR